MTSTPASAQPPADSCAGPQHPATDCADAHVADTLDTCEPGTVSPAETVAPPGPDDPLITRLGTVRSRVDPRTKLLFLIVVNSIMMHAASESAVAVCTVVAAALLWVAGGWSALRPYLIAILTAVVLLYVVPLWWQNTVVALLATIGYWTIRFGVAIAIAAYVVLTTGPAQFTAALRRLKVPSAVIIPFAVVLRFIPTVIDELRAITDAMRLRGLFPGTWGLLAHPLRTAEYVLVPLLSSTTRMADELSAAALTRGLGGVTQPTSIVELRFTRYDLALLAVTALIVVANLFGHGVLR